MSGRSRWVVTAAVLAVVLAGAGAGVWGLVGRSGDRDAAPPAEPPEPKPQTPEQIAAYVASKDFTSLSLDDREGYLESLRTSDPNVVRSVLSSKTIPPEQLERVRRNVGNVVRERAAQYAREYAALPAEQKPAYLDKVIDDLKSRNLVQEKSASTGSAAGGSGSAGRPFNAAEAVSRIRSRLETTDPAERAQHIQFLLGLRGRLSQRGLVPSFDGPGGMPPGDR